MSLRGRAIPHLAYQRLQVHDAPTPAIQFAVSLYFSSMMVAMRVPRDCELHVTFMPIASMRQLHCERKGRDRPTDVLTCPGSGAESFDLLHGDGFHHSNSSSELLTGDTRDRSAPCYGVERSERLDLGDIYICPSYIRARCRRHPNRNLKLTDYARAAYVHAFLHSLGHEHDDEEDFNVMAAREKWLASRVTRDWERKLDRLAIEELYGTLL